MKREKAVKKLGVNVVTSLDVAEKAELEQVVVNASAAIKEACEQLENNEKFKSLKEAISEITAGKKEAVAYQKAKIDYSLKLLKDKESRA